MNGIQVRRCEGTPGTAARLVLAALCAAVLAIPVAADTIYGTTYEAQVVNFPGDTGGFVTLPFNGVVKPVGASGLTVSEKYTSLGEEAYVEFALKTANGQPFLVQQQDLSGTGGVELHDLAFDQNGNRGLARRSTMFVYFSVGTGQIPSLTDILGLGFRFVRHPLRSDIQVVSLRNEPFLTDSVLVGSDTFEPPATLREVLLALLALEDAEAVNGIHVGFAMGPDDGSWPPPPPPPPPDPDPDPDPNPDNQPPTADAGPDQTVEATGPLTGVSLDGTASSDPDGDPLSFEWTGSFGVALGQQPTVNLGVGPHAIQLTVSDGSLMDADETQVTVRDTTPPVVTAPPDLTVPRMGDFTPVVLDPDGVASAADLVDGQLTPTPSTTGPFALGEHVVTWSVEDTAGNEGTASQRVSVVEGGSIEFIGFFPPVDHVPDFNEARAGSSVPLKWQLRFGGALVRDLSTVTSIQAVPIECSSDVNPTPVEADTSGVTGLRYDMDAEQFVYVWRTSRALAGTCAQVRVTLSDGAVQSANFLLR